MKLRPCFYQRFSLVQFLFFLTFSFLFVNVTFAKDIESGSVEVAGYLDLSLSSLSVTRIDQSLSKRNNKNLSGYFSYYLFKNVSIGCIASFSSSNITEDDGKSKTTKNILGPAVSLYRSINHNLGIQILASIASVKTTLEIDDLEIESKGHAWTLQSGVIYFLNENIAANANIQYIAVTQKGNGREDYHSRTLSSAIGISVFIK